MALSTFVKISTVTNLSDARYCAGMGVDALGFRLEEGQPGFVNPTTFHGITEWLAGVALVGEFLGTDAATIREIARDYPLDYIQVDHAEVLNALKDLGTPKVLRVSPESLESTPNPEIILDQWMEVADFVLVEPEEDYNSKDLLDRLSAIPGVVLGFNITLENLDKIPNQAKGIALKGGEEERPGFRDYEELMDILEALEVED